MWHVIIAVSLQIIIGLTSGNWLLGGAMGVAVFVGREHAQAEYRWIERYGFGRRINMPWWGGFDPKVWNVKSLLDWIAPLAFVAIVGAFA